MLREDLYRAAQAYKPNLLPSYSLLPEIKQARILFFQYCRKQDLRFQFQYVSGRAEYSTVADPTASASEDIQSD